MTSACGGNSFPWTRGEPRNPECKTPRNSSVLSVPGCFGGAATAHTCLLRTVFLCTRRTCFFPCNPLGSARSIRVSMPLHVWWMVASVWLQDVARVTHQGLVSLSVHLRGGPRHPHPIYPRRWIHSVTRRRRTYLRPTCEGVKPKTHPTHKAEPWNETKSAKHTSKQNKLPHVERSLPSTVVGDKTGDGKTSNGACLCMKDKLTLARRKRIVP